MKLLLYTILFCGCLSTFAQKSKYIIVEEVPLFQTQSVGPFKLRTNHVLLNYKRNNTRTFNIYNLYFSNHSFEPAGIDKKAFIQGADDFTKLKNDVLITVTPLTDSLEFKLEKITGKDVKKMDVLPTDRLLQDAISNLYISFVKTEIASGMEPPFKYDVKNYKRKLIIKRGNNYYKANCRVLLEYYLVDQASYAYPNQYHEGEINLSTESDTQYFSINDVNRISSTPISINNRGGAFESVILPEKGDTTGNMLALKFNTIPVRGAGTFYFTQGIGIINGSFDYFFNDFIKAQNDPDFLPGKILLQPKTINGLSIPEFKKAWAKQYPPRVIIEL